MARGRQEYLAELRRVAKRLGIRGADLQAALVAHFQQLVRESIKKLGTPATLSELVDGLAAGLGVEFVEIHDDSDEKELLYRIPPSSDPRIAAALAELDDDTDAVTVRRLHPGWERPFIAIINCRGVHATRRFFSKWHELVHRFIEGQQLELAFRKTLAPSLRQEPEEVLVDVIAGSLAFHPDVFGTVFTTEYNRAGRLTFDVVDSVRWRVAPDASRLATTKACVRNATTAVVLLRAKLGLKKSEERQDTEGTSRPVAVLRVRAIDYSPSAEQTSIRFHLNMRVPSESVVAQAFRGILGRKYSGTEALNTWSTSSGGPIGEGSISIEALKFGDEVWAFVVIAGAADEPLALVSGSGSTRTVA